MLQPDGEEPSTRDAGADAGAECTDGLDRIWTVPNLLSVGRLGLVGIFCWLLFTEHERVAAAAVLAVAGVTDFVDGYFARRFNQVTTLGKVLDPTADRIVLGVGIIAITVYGAVPIWLGVVVLSREVLVSAAVLALAALGAKRIDVLFIGKAATFGLMVCFPVFLASDSLGTWPHFWRILTWVFAVPFVGLGLVAAAAYVPVARRALIERRLNNSSPGRVRST